MDIETLSLLERKVEAMLAQYNSVCEERERLSQQLVRAEERVQELEDRLSRAEKERGEVKVRVEKILERLNGLDLG